MSKPRIRWVTARLLRDEHACQEAYDAFIGKYGHKAKVRPIDVALACVMADEHNWARWLIFTLLPLRLRDEWWAERPYGSSAAIYRYARMISAEAKP